MVRICFDDFIRLMSHFEIEINSWEWTYNIVEFGVVMKPYLFVLDLIDVSSKIVLLNRPHSVITTYSAL